MRPWAIGVRCNDKRRCSALRRFPGDPNASRWRAKAAAGVGEAGCGRPWRSAPPRGEYLPRVALPIHDARAAFQPTGSPASRGAHGGATARTRGEAEARRQRALRVRPYRLRAAALAPPRTAAPSDCLWLEDCASSAQCEITLAWGAPAAAGAPCSGRDLHFCNTTLPRGTVPLKGGSTRGQFEGPRQAVLHESCPLPLPMSVALSH
eukprot:148425-Chlamydomonas_euryale.AAC.4